ncbi:MAG: hypothetical protein H7326_09405 [Bdellovibrionaceae bacterium]|nr:hypothetical protein [Pseudobdellovibrionaceae bacterium]
MKNIFLSLLVFGFAATAFASEPEYIEIREFSRQELVLSGGTALQSGYLTRRDSVGTYGVDVNLGLSQGLLSFSWQGFQTEHDTNEFSLANNKSVSAMAFSFLPYLKVCGGDKWNAYAGIGFTQVGLYQESPEYSFNYGTFVVSGLFRYGLSSKWSLHYKTNWYNVEQTVNDMKTSFEVWSHVVGVGFSYF